MKKLKKYAKTTLCIVLSAAMMFTGTGMTVFADESTQAEETQQELYVEETEETSIEEVLEGFSVEEAPAGEERTEQVSEEDDFGEESTESTLTEKNSDENSTTKEQTDDEDVEDLTEKTESEVVSTEEIISEDGIDVEETETESEVFENELKLSVFDMNIAHGEYKENGNNITWVIDEDGKLTVEGTGEFASGSANGRAPWYANRSEIKTAEINVTGMKDASYMFWGCSNLTSVDVSKFDTSQVTDMRSMFYGCWNLTDLDVSKFDTSQVTNMNCMFIDCHSLADLDVSKFDTSQVTDMDMMFFDCRSLTNLDVSKFDTSQVDSMGMMFSGCSSLTNLDVSKFKTSQVTNMLDMFAMCSSLTDLDVSKFDTSQVTNMKGMFLGCSSLTNLDVSKFDTSQVTNMRGMFLSCGSLTDLDVSKFDTSQVTNMWGMFEFCSNLTDLNVSKFDTSQVTDMGNMFYECSSLTTLNLSNWDLGNLSEGEEFIDNVFYNCQALKRIYTPKNLHFRIMLEGDGWQDTSGNTYTELPTERSDSIVLTKGAAEGGNTDDVQFDLGSVGAIADIKAKVYDGEAYEPVVKVTVTIGGKKTTLTEGADYSVSYANHTNAGTGKVTVKGNGAYKGEIEKNFTINPKSVKKLKVITGGITANTTAGDLSTLPVYVYDGTKQLQYDIDYTLSKYETVKSGAQVTVTGKGNYDKDTSVVAKIAVYETGDAEKLIKSENVTLKGLTNNETPYTGKAIKPEVEVKINDTPLDAKNYKVQYQNNKDAGTAYVIVTGKGEYKGKAVVPFTIKTETAENPENAFMIKDIKAKTYNGKLQKPSVNVSIKKDGKDKKLSKKDYTVSYASNLHAGTATVIITGKGNYAGLSAKKDFTINPQQIKKASLKGTQGNLVLTYSKKKLKQGTDYETPVYGTPAKGKVEVTITGKAGGDFTGELKKSIKTQ